MSGISDMIQRLCLDGVEYRKLGEIVNFLSLSARRRGPCKNPSLSVGFAALRAPHPFPLAAWALANYLKLTALRESLSLRDLGRWPTSLPRLRRGVAKEKENQLSSELDADFLFLLRRGRDSNPRSLSAQQFSRLP